MFFRKVTYDPLSLFVESRKGIALPFSINLNMPMIGCEKEPNCMLVHICTIVSVVLVRLLSSLFV